jgi:hypothetical protein
MGVGLLQQYPNVLAIDVGDVIRQVQSIMDQVSRAVEFVFLFTLLGGLLVLQAAIAATQDERRFDAAILRTIGASAKQLSARRSPSSSCSARSRGCSRRAARRDRLGARRPRVQHSVFAERMGVALRRARRRARRHARRMARHAQHARQPPLAVIRQLG